MPFIANVYKSLFGEIYMFVAKKGLVLVIVVVLLILVSISAFISVQNWFNSYRSQIDADANGNNMKNSLDILKVDGTNLFLRNDYSQSFMIYSILIDGRKCPSEDIVVNKGVVAIDIGNCTLGFDSTKVYTISLLTIEGVYSSAEVIRNPVTS